MLLTCSGLRIWLLIGITTPLILIWIGAPAVKNMSEACLSAISLKSGVTNMTVLPWNPADYCATDRAGRASGSETAQEVIPAKAGSSVVVVRDGFPAPRE